MISTLSLISMSITLVISLILPILLYVFYGFRKKKKEVWIAGALGALGFAILQVDIRIPLLNKISEIPSFLEWVSQHYIWYCLFLAFTAGLFEVIGRYAVAKILCFKKKITPELTYETGIAAGIGHGGIEAILLIGMTYVNNLIFAVMINTGVWEKTLSEVYKIAEESGNMSLYQAYAPIQQVLSGTPWYLYLAAGYERILTIIAHIAMTMIVFYFVSKKKDIRGILTCLLCHTMLDFVSTLVSGLSTDYLGNVLSQGMAYTLVYIFLTVVAVLSLVFLLHIKKIWKQND